MDMKRSAGVLLHPTSLTGGHGIGDLGPVVHHWIDWLGTTDTSLWQVLPLGPTGYGDSPYQCFSSAAGNPYLISLDGLVARELLEQEDLDRLPPLSADRVDYGSVIPAKLGAIDQAAERLPHDDESLTRFRAANGHWLDDFALFMALKAVHGGRPWWTWAAELRDRHADSIDRFQDEHQDLMHRYRFQQWAFFDQWRGVRNHAREAGLQIIGDIPIFVAADSADVWGNRRLFLLNDDGTPSVVAGVPPDYFSPTGQLWGNPLYDWELHRSDGYRWWIERLRAVLSMVDIVRLDHFRGFAAYWEVPGDASDAVDGRWVPGPGADFLESVIDEFGDLPIIAEDLGEITPDVIALRDQFGLPGMKILQFAFDSGEVNDFLPHRYPERCVVYTGTHDNDTARGWFESAGDEDRAFACEYLRTDGSDFAWDLVEAAWHSRAAWAIAPIQDLLELPSEARMNTPSVPGGNWQWRMPVDALTDELSDRLSELNQNSNRSPQIAADGD